MWAEDKLAYTATGETASKKKKYTFEINDLISKQISIVCFCYIMR